MSAKIFRFVTCVVVALLFSSVVPGCSSTWPKPVKFGSMGRDINDGEFASRKATNLNWSQSYEDALAEAQATDKAVLALFTGSDWCKWCIHLKEDVLETPEFADWAQENVVLLELDYPRSRPLGDLLQEQNERLKEKYQVSGFPTVLLLDASGNVMGKMGYMKQPEAWVSMADEQLRR